MTEEFKRTGLILGAQALEKLKGSRVCVFGVGGVGSYVVEALARSGVGSIDVVDNDEVATSNINRQIIALHSTVGMAKVDVAKDRILDINPECEVRVHKCFYLPETASEFEFDKYDYVVDAIDTVAAKIDIIMRCTELGTRVISSMGTGNKLDPTRIKVTDIYKTEGDPLARVMRRELKKRGVKKLKVVYSSEAPLTPDPEMMAQEMAELEKSGSSRRSVPGSVAFVPSVAGLVIASEVVKDLIK
ncbi:tRNA threonylcarbamoyladenosine dehydratase [Butyrivibrio sp. FCS014]|uniref:tRNA threonylcarbamoyladenosine dehydratase n=1 Tax=Butyrivibrio sp. FCS014 TaxID=1408304 RepID=UPI000464DC57|nr:tRNA threonylcarbamoyladenosine dehydratase [Butyrivibrio sp. FCS014]